MTWLCHAARPLGSKGPKFLKSPCSTMYVIWKRVWDAVWGWVEDGPQAQAFGGGDIAVQRTAPQHTIGGSGSCACVRACVPSCVCVCVCDAQIF